MTKPVMHYRLNPGDGPMACGEPDPVRGTDDFTETKSFFDLVTEQTRGLFRPCPGCQKHLTKESTP